MHHKIMPEVPDEVNNLSARVVRRGFGKLLEFAFCLSEKLLKLLLDFWKPTVSYVSHNRHRIDRVTDRLEMSSDRMVLKRFVRLLVHK
jgi:hypothetical protein